VEARLADIEQGLVRFQGLRLFSPPWSSWRGRPALTREAAGSSPAGGAARPSACGGDGHPAGAGSTPAGQTGAVEERLSSRAS
jgi:hypothetical protein